MQVITLNYGLEYFDKIFKGQLDLNTEISDIIYCYWKNLS